VVVIADYQVITDRDRATDLDATITALVLDYLACGLDPDDTVIFTHSAVPALNQLMLPFLSLVSAAELARNPTTKEEIRLAGRRSVSGLMLTYPVHQARDILFCKADLVPVGRDQLPHVELSRAIARRFAERYGPVFPVPEAQLGEVPLLAGLDGRKMGKSRGNAIALGDSDDVVAAKLRAARTDSEREITYEPQRRPEVANLLRLGGLCRQRLPEELAAEIGSRGAVGLKEAVTDAVCAFLAPFHRRRRDYSAEAAVAIVAAGNRRANDIAAATLNEVRAAMGMTIGSSRPSRAVTVDV
jgi:tryptophanyl-tRNA synthetase